MKIVILLLILFFFFGNSFSAACAEPTAETHPGNPSLYTNTTIAPLGCKECYLPYVWTHCIDPICANTTAPENILEKIQCYYNGDGPEAWVNSASGQNTSGCGAASGAVACKTIEFAKWVYRYNTTLHLDASDIFYHLQPPANLTAFWHPTAHYYIGAYFIVDGSGEDTTTIEVSRTDYDTNMYISGSVVYAVVLYISSPNTTFTITKVTIKLIEVPAPDAVLVWVRNGAVFTANTVTFSGDGQYWPKHLFEQSGGTLSLINTTISPTGSGAANYIKGSIVYWDGTGRANSAFSSTHIGAWSFINCTFSNIALDYDKSLLEEANNAHGCKLNVTFERCKFMDIVCVCSTSSFSRVHRRVHSAGNIAFGLIYTINEFTGGDITITDVEFINNDCHRIFASPILILSFDDRSHIITLSSLTWNNCINGAEGATIVTYVSINSTNFIIGDIEKGSGNYYVDPATGEPQYTNRITMGGPNKGELTVCLSTYDLNCRSEKKRFPSWAVAVIIAVVVAVLAGVAVAVVVGVCLCRRGSHTPYDEEDGCKESDTTEVRSADDERF